MVINMVISKIKGIIKEYFIRQQNRKYEEELKWKYVSYDRWIKKIENKKREYELLGLGEGGLDEFSIKGNRNPLQLQVINYEECGNWSAFDHETVDIFLFAREVGSLSTDCIEIVKKYFSNNLETMILYGDEDEWNQTETVRMNPWLKPDWSPDTLQSFFYFGNVVAIRKELFLKTLCRMTEIPKENSDWEMALYHFFLEAALLCSNASSKQDMKKIVHIPEILCHSHQIVVFGTEEKFSDIKETIYEKYRKKQETKTCEGSVEQQPTQLQGQQMQESINSPKSCISIIIPSKDNPHILEMCLSSIYQNTHENMQEIIVVDNGSSLESQKKIREVQKKYPFVYHLEEKQFNFSHMCNTGASLAKGKILLFLNDDIEVKQGNWLCLMQEKVNLPYVGAVGAKLLYPDGERIQHVGITNLEAGPIHKMLFLPNRGKDEYYRSQVPYNVIAVTAAAMMIKQEVFEKAGGFAEELAVAYNDVDLCFTLHELGYYNVVRNDVTLWHHESLSRGSDNEKEKSARLEIEKDELYDRHPSLSGKDPYYHEYYAQSMIDTRFHYQYQYGKSEMSTMESFSREIPSQWENECLQVSLDCGKHFKREVVSDGIKKEMLLFEGFAYVLGMDNSCYKRSLLLKNTETNQCKIVWLNTCLRPDVDWALADQVRAALSGFSVMVDRESLAVGEYQIGILAEDLCSRQKLVTWTNRYIN